MEGGEEKKAESGRKRVGRREEWTNEGEILHGLFCTLI